MATIGVTGHRVLSDHEILLQSVKHVLTRATEKFKEEPMALLTSLAEGTDRLVAKQFRSLGSRRIIAVLPLTPEDYRKDFESDESRREFSDLLNAAHEVIQLPHFSERNEAYEVAGHYVVDHCDALICLWDGQREQGRGGTSSNVERARKRGIPIAWILAGNREFGTLNPTSLGIQQGKIIYENWS
jgi:hypothetical protein